MSITKPMKPAECNERDICKLAKYLPLFGTYKEDGIGALMIDGKAVSTSFKPIKNWWIRTWMEKWLPDGMHGELTLKGNPTFQDVTSAVMSETGMPNFEYRVFDFVSNVHAAEASYETRMKNLKFWYLKQEVKKQDKVKPLLPKVLHTLAELKQFYKQALNLGYEGIVVRTPDSPYKCGKCTDTEGYAWKIKPFSDSEGEIIGFLPYEINDSPQTKDAFGRSKRQHLQACKRSVDALGKFVVRWQDKEFNVGGGDMTWEFRVKAWKIRKTLLGERIKFRYQKKGTKEGGLPRSPQFAGIRDREDI